VAGFLAIESGATDGANVGAPPAVYACTGVLYLPGDGLFGVAARRAGILPRWAAGLLAAGTVAPFALAPLPTRSCGWRRCRWAWRWPGWAMRSGRTGGGTLRRSSLAGPAANSAGPQRLPSKAPFFEWARWRDVPCLRPLAIGALATPVPMTFASSALRLISAATLVLIGVAAWDGRRADDDVHGQRAPAGANTVDTTSVWCRAAPMADVRGARAPQTEDR
jgi:hypothetical protein